MGCFPFSAIEVLSLTGVDSTAQGGSMWRAVLGAAIGLAVALTLLIPQRNVLRFGLFCWIASFGLGFRTTEIVPGLRLHPSEVILWVLFAALLVRAAVFGQRLRVPRFPRCARGFIALVLVGAAVAFWQDRSWTIVLRAMKPTLGMVPAFFVVYNLAARKSEWDAYAVAAVLTGAYIALMGVAEYSIPGFTLPFADFIFNEPVQTAPGGFRRAMFAFWGSPIAVFVPLVFIPWVWAAWNAKLPGKRRVAAGGLAFIYILALYISGYRGFWMTFLVMLLAHAYVGGMRARVGVILAVILGLQVLPAEFYRRIDQMLTLDPTAMTRDTDRILRITGAWDQALRRPLLGLGWGGAGWVHSDWLQIATDLGFPALFCFIAWYGGVMMRVRRVAWRGRTTWTRAHGKALFASLSGIAAAMGVEALMVSPEMIFPVWFIFALASKLGEDEGGAVNGQAYRSHSHLQQRGYHSRLPRVHQMGR